MRHGFHFHGMSRRRFEYEFSLYNDFRWINKAVVYPSKHAWHQFTNPGGMEDMVRLPGKTEPGTSNWLHATEGTSSDRASARKANMMIFYNDMFSHDILYKIAFTAPPAFQK